MLIRRRDIDVTRLDHIILLGLPDDQGAVMSQDLRYHAAILWGNMLHHDDANGKSCRDAAQDDGQGLESTSRRCQGNNIEGCLRKKIRVDVWQLVIGHNPPVLTV